MTTLPAPSLLRTPWALEEGVLQRLLEADRAGWPETAARSGGAMVVPSRRSGPKLAVIPVHGLLEHRPTLASLFFGGTTHATISAALEKAVADPAVQRIVLDVDSPGGSAYGLHELATEIRQARERKPITAIANPLALSAAYFIASSASEVVATPSGEVGSVGVYLPHYDRSGQLGREGVKVTLISAGEGKTDANPFEPLRDEARAELQRTVNRYYGQFVDAVAAGRGVQAATVRNRWKARVYGGAEAVSKGLADRVGTMRSVLEGSGAVRGGAAARAIAAARMQRARILVKIARDEAELRCTR